MGMLKERLSLVKREGEAKVVIPATKVYYPAYLGIKKPQVEKKMTISLGETGEILRDIKSIKKDLAFRKNLIKELGREPAKVVPTKPREPQRVVKKVKEAKLPTKVEKAKEKVIRVPETQLPVGEGKEKVSRLEARVRNALGVASKEEIERLGLSTFRQMSNKAQIAKASEFVVNNTDEAFAVIRGDIDPPSGVLKNSVYVVLKNLGAADTEIATKVASLASSRFGQEVEILREVEVDSPVTLMEDVVRVRVEAYERKTRKKASEQVKKGAKRIKTKAPTKNVWIEFVKSLEC